jgi:hypothetical protein
MQILPPGSSVYQFLETYHLWPAVLVLCALGVYHGLTIVIWHWFRLLGEAHEAYYSFKIRCTEDRRRYQRLAGEKEVTGQPVQRHAGAD